MLEAISIKKSYGSSFEVLKGIDISVTDRTFNVILGASGSGKTTLLNILSGLEKPDSGKIVFRGEEITEFSEKKLTAFRRDNVGFVFQQYYLLPSLNVDKNVKMGADIAKNKNYRELICSVGLGDKLYKYPHELSGGEQQRVAIARALAKKPKILFLDEPTGALDEGTGRMILKLLLELQKKLNFCAVMVTHNTNLSYIADTVIKMNSGKIIDISNNSSPKCVDEIDW